MATYDELRITSTAISILKQRYKTEEELLHTLRLGLEPIILQSLSERYGAVWNKLWNDLGPVPVGDTPYTILLVERRCHPYIRQCIQNAVYYARNFSLTIVCSDQNEPYIRACCEPHQDRVRILPLLKGFGTPEQGKREYNELLKQADFWDKFQEEKVLTIETDTYLKKPLHDELFQYDYVASRWAWIPEAPGGGGLSFRSISMMKDISMTGTSKAFAQDCFVSDALQTSHTHYKIPSSTAEFFCESIPSEHVYGIHQWWTFLASSMRNGFTNWIEWMPILLTCDILS